MSCCPFFTRRLARLMACLLVLPLTHAAADAPALLPNVVKIAAVQIKPREGHSPAEDAAVYIRRAAEDGADLVVFPEYHLGFTSVPGPSTEVISKAAAEGGIYVIIGCLEGEPEGQFYNTALLFDRSGAIAGKYHKTHAAVGEPPFFWPAKGDELEARMTEGDSFPVFQTDFGKVGIFICYDGYFPEVPNILSLQGAEILVWINGRAGSIEDFFVRTITYQTYTALVATNTSHGYGTTIGTFPATILAHAPTPEDDYITAEVDLEHLRLFRQNSRVFHQRRPEIYSPLTRPHRPWESYPPAASISNE
jgi:beta-ureidopropionase